MACTLELVRSYWSVQKKPRREYQPEDNIGEANLVDKQKQSIEDIIRVAGIRFIQFQDLGENNFYVLTDPFGPSFSGLSEEVMKEVEITHLLLTADNKGGKWQFDRARRLVS